MNNIKLLFINNFLIKQYLYLFNFKLFGLRQCCVTIIAHFTKSLNEKILIKTAITLASLFLLGISIYELNKLYYNSRERQQYVSDLAYSNNIRFGF